MLLAQAMETMQTFQPRTSPAAYLAFIPMLLGLATWVITLVVIWRAMKAHESIAESLRKIAQKESRV